jgi:hypothetical protein
MRILARTLAILAVAAAVAGGVFAIVQSSYAQILFPARPTRGAFAGEQSPATGAQATDTSLPADDGAAFGRPDHEGGRSPSLFGAVEVFQDLAIVSIIVAIVSLVKRAWRGRRQWRPPGVSAGNRG